MVGSLVGSGVSERLPGPGSASMLRLSLAAAAADWKVLYEGRRDLVLSVVDRSKGSHETCAEDQQPWNKFSAETGE